VSILSEQPFNAYPMVTKCFEMISFPSLQVFLSPITLTLIFRVPFEPFVSSSVSLPFPVKVIVS
jgi:hypothetical protein